MRTIAKLLGSVFDGDAAPLPVAAPPPPLPVFAAPAGRARRRKVWELPGHWHCPLLGTCLPLAEMRRLARRSGYREAEMADFVLHSVLVNACAEDRDFAGRLQRSLDQRYRAAVGRFAQAGSEEEVLALWREALRSGEVAPALWAAWTHPAIVDEHAGKTIFGDIHMLSHQMGATARADLRLLERFGKENVDLRRDVAALRRNLGELGEQRDGLRVELGRRETEAQAAAARLSLRDAELAEAQRQARDYGALRERADALASRAAALEERNAANARRARQLKELLNEATADLAAAESALEMALAAGASLAGEAACGRTCPSANRLAGRCVLCIGGRAGLVEGYRRLVETAGGRFLYHDGGEEQSLHRLDGAVSGADAVVCQSACVSHAAYWRLKEACKKLGKPCVFVQAQGLSSFARGLAALSGEAVPEVAHLRKMS